MIHTGEKPFQCAKCKCLFRCYTYLYFPVCILRLFIGCSSTSGNFDYSWFMNCQWDVYFCGNFRWENPLRIPTWKTFCCLQMNRALEFTLENTDRYSTQINTCTWHTRMVFHQCESFHFFPQFILPRGYCHILALYLRISCMHSFQRT